MGGREAMVQLQQLLQTATMKSSVDNILPRLFGRIPSWLAIERSAILEVQYPLFMLVTFMSSSVFSRSIQHSLSACTIFNKDYNYIFFLK